MKGHLTIVQFHELPSALQRERTDWSFQTLGFAKHEAQNSPHSICRHLDTQHTSQHFHFIPDNERTQTTDSDLIVAGDHNLDIKRSNPLIRDVLHSAYDTSSAETDNLQRTDPNRLYRQR